MGGRVVTFGEVMLRLNQPGFERLLQSPVLEATFGGGEANVAVSLAYFGVDAAYVSVLPDNPNVIIDLRIPGKPEYVDSVLDLHVCSAIVGEEEPAKALQTIYDEWQKITDRLGRDSQKTFYRRMMGMK